MDKTHFFQSTFLKWEKILDKLPHRSYFKSDKDEKNQNNLGDGKNGAGSSGKNIIKVKEDDIQSEAKANVGQSGVEINEDQTDAAQFNKYQEVDDLINGAIENIQEAAAALANLAGSHEHELKMIIMNILVRFHDWIDNIQKKLNLTKKALNDLKWILATKDIELKVKNHEVNELRHSITEYEQKLKTREEEMNHSEEASNSLAIVSNDQVHDSLEPGSKYFIAPLCQNVSTAAVTHVTTISLSSSLKISSDNALQPEFVTAEHSVVFSVAKATNAFSIGSKNSEHEVEVNDIATDLPMPSENDTDSNNNNNNNNLNPENRILVTQPRKLRSKISQRKVPVALANMSASRTIVSNVSSESVDRHTVLLDMSSMEVGNEEAKQTQLTYQQENSDGIVDVEKETPISRPLPRILEQQSSLTLTDSNEDKDNRGIRSPEIARVLDQSTNLPDISALRMSILRASVNNGKQTSDQSIRDSGTSVIYEQRLSSQTNLKIPVKEKPIIINITQPRSSNSFDLFRQSVNYDKERKEDERDKREAELKEQISEIRRENDKLRRDNLKYESAVKKALFSGFMSLIKEEKLNVPKKRITKICYTPCAPCSTITSSTSNKPSVPNLKVTESLTSQEPKRVQSKKYVNAHPSLKKQSLRNSCCLMKQNNVNSCVKIPELYIPAENVGTGIETICQGGYCSTAQYCGRKAVKDIDRFLRRARTSKARSHMHKNSATGYNNSPTGLEEYTRVMGCKNVVTTLPRRIN